MSILSSESSSIVHHLILCDFVEGCSWGGQIGVVIRNRCTSPPPNDFSSPPSGSTTRVPSGNRPMKRAATIPRICTEPEFNNAKQLALIVAAAVKSLLHIELFRPNDWITSCNSVRGLLHPSLVHVAALSCSSSFKFRSLFSRFFI